MNSFSTSTAKSPHIPVLLREMSDCIAPRNGGVYLDGTFGAGGYARALLEHADCRVIGIDRDPDAVARSKDLVESYEGRLHVVSGRFSQMQSVINGLGLDAVDGVALDLGVSSMQIDNAERGFSFQSDGPLDMRMEQTGKSAADIVNTMEERDLAQLIWVLGEEKRSRAIARAIVSNRDEVPFTTTRALAETVAKVLGRGGAKQKIHPATRTFQALRLYVNDELAELVGGVIAAERILRSTGVLVVVSFHSLEDRIVKRMFRARTGPRPRTSRHLPDDMSAPNPPSFTDITPGGLTPDDAEIQTNPRARSARLRAVKRTDAPVFSGEEFELKIPKLDLSEARR